MEESTIVSANYRVVMGTISLLSGIGSHLLSGLAWYNPDSSGTWALITLGSTLIGIGLAKELKK